MPKVCAKFYFLLHFAGECGKMVRKKGGSDTQSKSYRIDAPITADFRVEYYLNKSEEITSARVFPPHVHDVLEFYILLEGDASFVVEQSLYRLSPGDIVISKPNEMHNCILNSDSTHKHLCFWFDPGCEFLFSDFLAHGFGEGNLCTPRTADAEKIIELIKKYDDEKARPFVNGVLNSVKNGLA